MESVEDDSEEPIPEFASPAREMGACRNSLGVLEDP